MVRHRLTTKQLADQIGPRVKTVIYLAPFLLTSVTVSPSCVVMGKRSQGVLLRRGNMFVTKGGLSQHCKKQHGCLRFVVVCASNGSIDFTYDFDPGISYLF